MTAPPRPSASTYVDTSSRPPSSAGRNAWFILALLALAELLGMSLWFTASATAPRLSELWGLTPTQVGWLTTVVQLGFVAGTAAAALFNVADVVPARRLFAVSALAAALANGALVWAPGFGVGLGLRFLTGLFLAGVYPPAMKMAATWFRSARGLAIGTIVGALTVGKALPYLAGSLDHRIVILGASAAAAVAAVLVASLYRDGPFDFPRRPFSWTLVGTVLRHRETRLAIGGYLGHMWELYAMWTLMALFMIEVFGAAGLGPPAAAGAAGLAAFGVIAIGGVGSVLAGAWADRLGRERVTIAAMLASGACSLGVGWLVGASPWLVVPLALVWGFAIVADSAQFSAVVTEVAPPHAVGTALTLQTSLGFALTAGSIWLAVEVSSGYGWGPAFSLLAVGPAVGIVAMLRLLRARRQAADRT